MYIYNTSNVQTVINYTDVSAHAILDRQYQKLCVQNTLTYPLVLYIFLSLNKNFRKPEDATGNPIIICWMRDRYNPGAPEP